MLGWLRARRFGLAVALATIALAGCGSSASETTARKAPNRPVIEFDLRQKGTPTGSTHEIVAGPDGNVWVTQQKQDMLVRVTPAGGKTFFPLPAGSGPHGIKFDRDGHLWLTFEFTNEIAKLDQGGHILRTYPIPVDHTNPHGDDTHPHGLAVARDGSIWWTGKASNVIGRLDPDRLPMQLFNIPTPESAPIYIAEGCDGMYFTELLGGKIGRVTDAGVITEFPTPAQPSRQPSRPIAVAPRDCRVWFSEETGHHFGVLDPETGRITEYPLPSPGIKLAALAFDRSGTLWLQYNTPDKIARVGNGMKLEEFPIPTPNAMMHRIILGPGGNMWFTELASDKVGYIDTR